MSLKLAVLISGRGSNLEALIHACNGADFPAEIAVVIANKPDAAGLETAAKAGLETLVVDHKGFDDREGFEQALQEGLTTHKPGLVVLAGFMRLLSADFVRAWKDRMINIHPSLLPAYKGLHTHERALEDGVRFSGCTIHYVRAEMDNGPIIAQAAVPVHPNDSAADLAARVLQEEHRLLPHAVRLIAQGKVRVSGNRVAFDSLDWPEKALLSPVPPVTENA
ncbi:phosphoribosylglycinamide formyltransferase [Yunchengibacter salinarum]|uniref:phosphoribosylglycinamide formyltransferase n=1 Tax=Yunchengibacter salinarum TaxID=3133399 RepID=UPI0035B60136